MDTENTIPPLAMRRSESISSLAAALAKAQAEIEGAVKGATNPHFRSKYADLGAVWEACRGPLTKNGLSVVQFPGMDGQRVTVETILMHSSGEWLSGVLPLPVTKMDAQGCGSAITYARRYSLMAVAGIAPEDDDGNEASKKPAKAITPAPDEDDRLDWDILPPPSPGVVRHTTAAASREPYKKLAASMKEADTPDILKNWATARADEIWTLGDTARHHLREAYDARMDELMMKLGDAA